jgi:hypothetical protein
MNDSIYEESTALHPYLDTLQQRALIVGVLGIVATIVGYFTAHEQFFRSYLLAFTFWIGLPLGSIGILMIHHVGGGTWAFSIRRLLEAGSRTLPLMFFLSLPILFLGMHELYEWTHLEVVAHDDILLHKAPYLNESFFIIRTFFYFAVWGILAFFLNRWSLQQDQTTETYPTHRLQIISGPGIVLFFLTVTMASIDWLMSLEPHWFSTIFGVIYIVGMGLMTWGFMYLVALPLSRRKPLDWLITEQRLRDLGTFMLACVMLWAYTSFSQLLIIWSANLPEEITWFITRLEGGWQYIGYGMVLFHFAVPFLFLISSTMKSKTKLLSFLAIGLIFMRLVDLYWIIAPAFTKVPAEHGPSFHSTGITLHWLDLAIPIGIGGILISLFFSQLKKRILIAQNDPRFADLFDSDKNHG